MIRKTQPKWSRQTSIMIVSLLMCVAVTQWQHPGNAHGSESVTARLAVQLGHGGTINSAVVSTDGRLLLTASDDGTARLWEIATGYELQRLEGHRDKVTSAVFSPDDHHVLTASDDGTARLWEIGTGREVRQFKGDGKVAVAVFVKDGSSVLTVRSFDRMAEYRHKLEEGLDKHNKEGLEKDIDIMVKDLPFVKSKVQLLDKNSGQELRQFEYTSLLGTRAPVVVSPDRQSMLILHHDGMVHLWSLVEKREPQRFGRPNSRTTSAAFSPKGDTIMIVSPDSVRLWDISTGREGPLLGKQADPSNSANLSGIASAVFSSDGNTILIAGWTFDQAHMLRDYLGLETDQVRPPTDEDARRNSAYLRSKKDKSPPQYGGYIKITISLWNVGAGREVWRFGWQPDKVEGDKIYAKLALSGGSDLSAALSPQDDTILIAFGDDVRVCEPVTGKELRRFEGHTKNISSAVFVANGVNVLTASVDRTARLWDTASGREVRRFAGATGVDPMVFPSLNEIMAIIRPRQFVEQRDGITSATVSSEGRYVLTANNNGTADLWEISTGSVLKRFVRKGGGVNSAVLSPDGRKVLTASLEGAYLWDTLSGREVGQPFAKHADRGGGGIASAVFSADGRTILTASWDKTARLWETDSRRELMRFAGHGDWLSSAVFSPDSSTVLTASWDKTARLWEKATGREIRRFEGHSDKITSAVFSPDGQTILTASLDQTARLWDTTTGREIRRFEGHSDKVASVEFSADGTKILTASWDGTARLWETSTGHEVKRFSGQGGGFNSARFAPAGYFIVTASVNGTTYIWENDDTKREVHELGRLVSVDPETWVVTTPEGRFDTNNLEAIKGARWVMSDDPRRSLPIESFIKGYYQPKLLSMLWYNEELRDIKPVGKLNRVRPNININQIRIEDEDNGLVSVTIDVTCGERTSTGKPKPLEDKTSVYDAYDLRLFRDGQLVAEFPEPPESVTSKWQPPEIEEVQWRRDYQIGLDLTTCKKTVTFHDIRLPRNAGTKQVEFSAYAFNGDQVKSATARTTFETPNPLTPRQAHAYIVTIGVNGFEQNAKRRLSFAANDANVLSTALSRRLKRVKDPETGIFLFGDANVVAVTLITDFGTGDRKDSLVINHATKDRIRAVIEKLSGKEVKQDLLADIENADRLQPARPEDLVVIAFATHGDTDKNGQFYLMPYDLGASVDKADILNHAISSKELSMWLRTLDSGQIVMIVDACYSAAVVGTHDFKPAPMSSHDLGQLAFDKGMRILAASQRDESAREIAGTQHGFLTSVLVPDGLKNGKADFRPKDTRIQLSEWLSYGVEGVPSLPQDGTSRAQTTIPPDSGKDGDSASMQQPKLFDYARGRDTLIEIIGP